LTIRRAVSTVAGMLRQARWAAFARLAAALVAVMLTGAPRVLALHAPAEKHRCTCAAHGAHECECALCHKAALTVVATDEGLPPCHRAAAQKELAAAGTGKSRGEACLEGTCGSGARPPLTLAGVEVFCLPASGAHVLSLPERPLPILVEPLLDRALEPETPPPKRA
jgi:hypothetical protein